MDQIDIIEASESEFRQVALLVRSLLLELDPNESENIEKMSLDSICKELFITAKIWAFLAKSEGQYIGIITLHECASIYAGGVFGEISEFYVLPEFRSHKVGELLLHAAINKGKKLEWKRLEVGTPLPEQNPKSIQFYLKRSFQITGTRLKHIIN